MVSKERKDYYRRYQQTEKYKKYHKEYAKARYAEIKKYISDYKLSKGCEVCGYNKCAEALDFHHDGEKGFSIGTNLISVGLKRIKTEVKKCKILCCRCHRELHSCLKSTTYRKR